MRKLTTALQKCSYLLLLTFAVKMAEGQTLQPELKIKDFAVWGGGASPSPYISTQGVFINNTANIQGNIGSNHLVDIKNNLTLTGSIYSSNRVIFKNNAAITGNIFAKRMGTTLSPSISGGTNNIITGNLTANGNITLTSGQVTGSIAVPAPANTNYIGPVPTGGVGTTFTLPVLPAMPNNTPFDNQVGTINITNTQIISPGIFRKMALTGNKTITFNGPGNYIFYEIDNRTSSNKFIFDLKNTTTGTINLFIIKDVRLGVLSVSTVNGNFPSRIYTEVHGNGSTFSGNSFNLQGPASIPAGSNVWLGNVWAPNGAISITNTFPFIPSTTPHIIGALWSAKSVTINNDLRLVYVAPANVPSYIDPYYPPPSGGKVNTANNIIGAELFSLSQNTAPITSITQNEIFVLDNLGKVMIEVVSKTPNNTTLRAQLIALGLTGIIDNGPHIYTITGFFPISNLQQLNNNSLIQYVRPLYPPISNAGQVTTQGDTTMRSHNVKARFGLDGTGVKIGVISDSYNSNLVAQNDIDQGDLPGTSNPNNTEPVQVLADTKGNDEGRAMLQIVHDVAPKSKLAFRTGFLSAGDFAKGILELAAPTLPGGRCDVIVDDITYITEPFLQDGVVAQTVDQVAAEGVTYFSSAGNFGNKSYESDFIGVTNTSVIPTGQIHRFGTNAADIYQTVNLKPGSYTIVLQWNDEFRSLGSTNGVQTDMDLYLVGPTGFTLFGFNRSNLFGDPFEVCPFTVKEETNAKLMVVRAGGTGNVRFKYIIFRGEGTILDYPAGGSSIVGHPNAEGAIAVGAMLYANFPQFTPVWPGVASFSSRGGTSTLKNNAFETRNKPELIGPNGTNTTVNLGGAVFNDGDPYPNFFGTSAAAPHVAAVGALLIQGRRKFALQTTVTPSEIRAHLQSSAGKFLNQGNFSFEGGFGYVQADSAVQQIANARPIIDTLMAVVPGSQNGTQPFQVKVEGKYLTSSTQVYYNGRPVATAVSSDRTEATATVPAIPSGQDPPFQLYNAAKSPSGEDGGLSEALHFFSAKIDVTVKAVNKSRKYGQANPTFTADVLINGVPINQTNITLAALKLDGNDMTFTTIATAASNAGLYGIFPSRTTPLANDDPLLSQYGFTFLSGTLTVEKMPLKITPENKQIKYGEYPGDIVYNYELSQSPANPSTLLEEVKALHKKYLADNALVVINGFNNQNPAITEADLLNMSTMASFQSVRNARKFILENGRLQPLVNNNLPASQIGDQRFIVDVSAQSLANYKLNSSISTLAPSGAGSHARGLLNIKALTNGSARASLNNAPPVPMVNGQLLAMVNGQLQALVNGQLQALVNGVTVPVDDLVFQNGQLLALVNNAWVVTTNGQLQAMVNSAPVIVELSVTNGQLQALVNGQLMALVNGQLQALVNGQLLAVVNGQLQALVNGQLMPLVNGQLVALVNGQLQAMVNGQLVALVNGQLMALVNGELEIVQELSLANGQLQALVNGQLQALVNGQLQAMVNGVVTNIPIGSVGLVNGQLQAMVNGQLQALVNGQLVALVNGQLQPLVNGEALPVQSVRQLANGQLQALVNGTYIPIANGQLQALVNGQLLAMVNGQLMALVNGELTFAVFANGQLQALVNGQLQALVNGQLQAMVNGQLQALVNSVTPVDNSYSIVNGQLQAIVNGQSWAYANGQLLALVNGQLQALVNNFDVSGTNNNAKTVVLVDQDDITLQSGDVGGMFAMNMITGLDAGMQKLIPGGFVNENFEVTYGLGQVEILQTPLNVKANDTTKVYGDPNPDFRVSYAGFAYGESIGNITPPTVLCAATNTSPVNTYPITLAGGSSSNYTLILQNGQIAVTKKALTISADNKSKIFGSPNPPLTLNFIGLVNGDSENNVCENPIVANTSVNTSTPTGDYPITIQVCNSLNYNITYTNGTFTVTGVAPAISCPANITVNNTSGQCGANVNFAATETTGSPASTITYSHAPGSFFPVGTTTVTATATNAIGSSVCNFTVTVTDNESPSIVCPDAISVSSNPASCDAIVTVKPPFIADNVSGNALNFDGLNDKVEVPDHPSLTMVNGLTIEAWVYDRAIDRGLSVNNDEFFNILVKGTYGYGLAIDSRGALNNRIKFWDRPNGSTLPISNSSLPSNQWVHVAVTVSDKVRFYLNGVLDGESSYFGGTVSSLNSPGILAIGNQGIGCSYPACNVWDGQIDEIRLWNVARSSTDIVNNINGRLRGDEPGLVAYYTFDQGTAGGVNTGLTTLIDGTVNRNNGTLQNFALSGGASNWTAGRKGAITITNNKTGTANASGTYPVGTTSVMWTATDAAGNASNCTQTVTVTDNQAPIITCPANVSVALNSAGSQVNISASIINNQVVISSSSVAQNAVGGLLPVQNDVSKAMTGSCDCPPGYAVVGYEGKVGEIVDQFRLICAPINSDGSPGGSTTTSCFNGGTGGIQVGPFTAPSSSWMVGFGIGDMIGYFNRSGTLRSIEGYSQTYTDVINGSTNRFLNTKMEGVDPNVTSQRTSVQYAPPGSVITGMNYHIDLVDGGPFSSAVQFKYQPLVAVQELASFAVTDNCTGNLTVNLVGNTTFTSANVGANPLTLQVTDAAGNSSTCASTITVANNNIVTFNCPPTSIGATNCVSNIILDGTQTVVTGRPSNDGNGQSDFNYQSFVTGNQSTWLREINVDMTRYPAFANTSMQATIYQGVSTNPVNRLGILNIPSYNGGVIDFSTINNGAPLQLLPNTSYTLQMIGTPGVFTNNYFWNFSTAVAGDPVGSMTNLTPTISGTLKMAIKLESCESNIPVATPYITGVGPEGKAISFDGNSYAQDGTSRVPESGPYTVSFWAKQTTNQTGIVEMLSQGRNLYIGHEQQTGYNGPRIGNVSSANRSGRSLTDISYNILTSPTTVVSKTTTAADFIRSKLVLSSLTANPVPGGDANRFWFTGKTALTKDEALSVTGDLDLGTVLQDCVDPAGVQHTALFDKKIYPGEGPEIFIVHGGLSGNFEILDENGNVALTIPYNAGNPLTVGGTVFTSSWSPAFYLRDNVNFSVEPLNVHFNTQNGIIAIDIQPGEMKRISGIRFGGGGGCNYTYEILGVQPDVMPYEMRIGDFNNTNVAFPKDGNWHNYALVRDVAGNNTHLYLDGELVHSKGTLSASPTGSVNGFILGAQYEGSEKFIGNMDEVKIYNYAMSASEVQCNQTRPTIGLEPGLVGYYNFEEGSGSVVNNLGSGGGNLTIQNPSGNDWVRSIEVVGFFNNGIFNPTQNYTISPLPDNQIVWVANGYNANVPFCTTSLTAQPPISCPSASALTNNSGTTSNPNSLFVNESVTDKDSKPLEDKLYPNPANSIVRLQLKDDVQFVKDIRMFDGVGKMNVLSARTINTGLYEINVSGLSPGIYFIQAKTAAGIKTFKFIKM